MIEFANQRKHVKGIYLIMSVAILIFAVIAFSSCGNQSNTEATNEDSSADELVEADSINEIAISADTVAEWKVSKDLADCSLWIEYPSYALNIILHPESNTFNRPILMELFLFSKGNNGKNLPLPGLFTLNFGDLHPIEGEDEALGSQWHIQGEDAKKMLEIMNKGDFYIRAVNNTDGITYSLKVNNQTMGASEAYNKLLELYNSDN